MAESYNLIHVVLIASNFERKPTVQTIDGTALNNASITTSRLTGEADPTLNIVVDVEIYLPDKENFDVKILVKMVGIFKKDETNSSRLVEFEHFAKSIAPNYVFPFVREHISSLSQKAGLPPILLPLVDFEELAKNPTTTFF
jgi:preprotein translocase subunit SecB